MPNAFSLRNVRSFDLLFSIHDHSRATSTSPVVLFHGPRPDASGWFCEEPSRIFRFLTCVATHCFWRALRVSVVLVSVIVKRWALSSFALRLYFGYCLPIFDFVLPERWIALICIELATEGGNHLAIFDLFPRQSVPVTTQQISTVPSSSAWLWW